MDGSEIASVKVSWEAVEGADINTVLFSAAVGEDQEGMCRDEPHSASDTVYVPNASIAVKEDVGSNVTSYLRAYTTYSVTVVAFSDVWGRTVGSEPITFTTPQRGKQVVVFSFGTLLLSRAGSSAVPGNVSATALSSTVISVQWSGLSHCRLVNGLIVKYRVQWRAQESGGLVESTTEVSGNWSSGGETALTGLTPSTNYSISVAGVNQPGDVGVYSHPVTVRTLLGSYLHTLTLN